jgi:soluble lytic murein transglycosylase-like protein
LIGIERPRAGVGVSLEIQNILCMRAFGLAARDTLQTMRHTLALLCLTGALMCTGISVPQNIGLNRPDAEADDLASARQESAERRAETQPSDAQLDAALDLRGPQTALANDDVANGSADARVKSSLERARAALEESNAPALSNQEICTRLVAVAQANNLPVGFFANLIWRESHFDHVAISRVGAMGIAQFMPDVADRLGLVDAFDARDALPASGRLLRTLRERFGNLGLVAAAYNAGPKRVSDWLQQRAGLPQETRDYVSLITGQAVDQWRNLKAKTVVFNIPRQVPCHRTVEFSAVANAERIEQQQKLAEEQRSHPKRRHAPRLLAKSRPRPSMIASRGRSS